MRTPAWLREPLVHFLAAGAMLFVLTSATAPEDESGRTIHIGREDLLVFMQGRAQVYDDEAFSQLFEQMTLEERRAMVRDAALQQALYREGATLGLAEADPLIRQRVVQQMRLLLMEEAAADLNVSDDEMEAFYQRNRAVYVLPPSLTFTHVYVPDGQAAERRAAALLERLREQEVPFDRAGQFGERFLYQLNYVDVGPALVESHFGEEFATALLELPKAQWQGPIKSEYGWHLVLVGARGAGGSPPRSAIEPQLREDALAEKRQRAAESALNRMLQRYTVVARSDLGV